MSAGTRQSTWSTDAPEASGGEISGICFIGGLPHCFYRRPLGFCREVAPRRSRNLQRPPKLRLPRRPQLPQRRVEMATGRGRVSLNTSSLQELRPALDRLSGRRGRFVPNSEGGSRAAFFVVG